MNINREGLLAHFISTYSHSGDLPDTTCELIPALLGASFGVLLAVVFGVLLFVGPTVLITYGIAEFVTGVEIHDELWTLATLITGGLLLLIVIISAIVLNDKHKIVSKIKSAVNPNDPSKTSEPSTVSKLISAAKDWLHKVCVPITWKSKE